MNELNLKLLEVCHLNQPDALNEIKLLLSQGADINALNHSNSTALHIAAQNNNFEIAKFLLENGIDVNFLNDDGWTALHFAAQRGYTEIVKLLINSGVKVDIQGLRYKRTALHYAVDQGKFESTFEILKAGGRDDIKDIHNKTPLDIAKSKNHQEIVNLLSKNLS